MGVSLRSPRSVEDVRDRALMDRGAAGDRGALEELFSHYNVDLYRSCLKTCRNRDDAIDAVQESFLRVFKKLFEQDVKIESFRDYLFMTARNVCLKLIAKRKRSQLTEEIPEPTPAERPAYAGHDPERTALINDQREIVRHASRDLPQRQYQALSMFELDGLSYMEIGNMLGLDPNAVAQLIKRARKRLLKAVQVNASCNKTATDICAKAMAVMPKRADGRLGEKDALWLEPHLTHCDICKTNLALMEEVGTSYRALLPPTIVIFERVFNDKALAEAISSSIGGPDALKVAAGNGVSFAERMKKSSGVKSVVASSAILLLSILVASTTPNAGDERNSDKASAKTNGLLGLAQHGGGLQAGANAPIFTLDGLRSQGSDGTTTLQQDATGGGVADVAADRSDVPRKGGVVGIPVDDTPDGGGSSPSPDVDVGGCGAGGCQISPSAGSRSSSAARCSRSSSCGSSSGSQSTGTRTASGQASRRSRRSGTGSGSTGSSPTQPTPAPVNPLVPSTPSVPGGNGTTTSTGSSGTSSGSSSGSSGTRGGGSSGSTRGGSGSSSGSSCTRSRC